MKADNSKKEPGGNNGKPTACVVDKLIEDSRELLLKSDGDSLVSEIEARLLLPWCADLPGAVSRQLPRVIKFWAGVKRWSWRFMLLYLLYVVAEATFGFYFEKQLEAWNKSDLWTNLHVGMNVFLRMLAVRLGLPKMDLVHELVDGQCLVGNPLFKKPLICCPCKFNVSLSKVTNVEKVMENFDKLTTSGKARSFLVVNYNQEPVSYPTIRETALANLADLNIGYNRFTTLSGPRVTDLSQLFADEAAPPANSAVLWHFGHVEALRHFRSLIRRPLFISRSLEINLPRQFLFFGSEQTERVSLDSIEQLDGQVYIVGLSGEIMFTVKSNPDCCKKVDNQITRSVVLKPGRLLSMPSACYQVFARRNGTEYAAAYMGSVAVATPPGKERNSREIKK